MCALCAFVHVCVCMCVCAYLCARLGLCLCPRAFKCVCRSVSCMRVPVGVRFHGCRWLGARRRRVELSLAIRSRPNPRRFFLSCGSRNSRQPPSCDIIATPLSQHHYCNSDSSRIANFGQKRHISLVWSRPCGAQRRRDSLYLSLCLSPWASACV